ncbi:hypothetical protein HELRODRAFT_174298 [Helobdella robusta]|uniref:Endonuclease/exonuclease/phosphatase domain-containing protein n=1 Tax=Helobdella robusta TaxID=6412 RepID=T1F7Y6_HELRO|nr:hypothetical protein HELRODRAFT_174298 [Helobdella robusta]ESO02861.1 hypothetical protein HELRODRAFT_174298 [Helobdella robusta]
MGIFIWESLAQNVLEVVGISSRLMLIKLRMGNRGKVAPLPISLLLYDLVLVIYIALLYGKLRGKRTSVDKRLAKLKCGLVNAWSAVNKAALLIDVICDEKVRLPMSFISSIYRPPGPVLTSFLDEFTNHLDFIIGHNLAFIIRGDFNAPAPLLDNLTVNDCVFSDHNIEFFDSTLFKPPSTIIHSCRRCTSLHLTENVILQKQHSFVFKTNLLTYVEIKIVLS